ncbi:MAG: GTP-binding protein [Candidatus Aenigmarchaeota archaeon]|nr:GTP-binding protein [Candidatus Aenigmarchaeota archaeon]
MKLTIGIEKLEEMLSGGIDSKSSVLLLTDTMVDKASFSQHMLSARIIDGDVGIYLTTTKTPQQILKNMYDHGWESKGMVFVDCISYTLSRESDAKYLMREAITNTNAAWKNAAELFRDALTKTKGFKFVVFDCLETFMGVGSGEIAKKIVEWKKLAKDTNTTCIYLLTNWGYKEEDIKKICGSVDVVVNLGTVEKKLLWMNYFTIGDKPKIFFSTTPTGVGIYVPKILITGPFHAGKSSIVKALSERAISIDRLGTTVALDHGYIEKKGMVCDIFGTPGQERFDWILKILAKDIWGIILVVDSTQPGTFGRALEMLEEVKGYGIPFIVFANKQDLPKALKPTKVKKKLGVIDVIGTSAKTKQGLDEGLKLLFDKIFKVK